MCPSIFLYVAYIIISYLVAAPLDIKIEIIVTVSGDCDFIILYQEFSNLIEESIFSSSYCRDCLGFKSHSHY